MNRKGWVELIIFLFVTITGLVCYSLFLFDMADARTGIEGVLGMMIAFGYALLLEGIAIRKRLTALEKEVKELKDSK